MAQRRAACAACHYSRSVSMASRDLLNFTDEDIPDLFVGEAIHEHQTARSSYPSWQVTGYRRSSTQLAELTARGLRLDETAVRSGRVKLLGNSRQRLLYDVDGSLQLLRLKTLGDAQLEPLEELNLRLDDVTSGGPAITTLPLSDGFMVETSDRVSWVGSSGVFEVSDVPAVTVRTFRSPNISTTLHSLLRTTAPCSSACWTGSRSPSR